MRHKMEILYNFVSELLQLPTLLASRDAFVTIDYGDTRTSLQSESYSAWFTRVLIAAEKQLEHEEVKQPTKRYSGKKDDRDVHKKRKVKEGRQKDIGSLLGAFT